ncbi:MAG: AmmeMemoRadiSam system protein B [Phycisphaeraceae bacterium]|nr:AmmeMemoRadiSam system protein B [Phycisphaeraceae bacterium]
MSQDATGPTFDPSKPHQQRPKMRHVRGFPIEAEGRRMLGLSDARQISDQMVVIVPELGNLIPLLDGTRTIEQVAASFGQGLGVEHVQRVVAQLDHAGLLEGPAADAMIAKVRADFDAAPNLPPAATEALTDMLVAARVQAEPTEEQKRELAAEVLREALDKWIDSVLAGAPDQTFPGLPVALMAPHLDYPRGWVGYASVWGRMRGIGRPDRVLILGTNHFGSGTGVTICDKGFQTALGTSPVDETFLGAIKKRLGPDLAAKGLEHRFDHEREHSIELQIPWIQHCLGPDSTGRHVPVLGVLIHDPAMNQGESYDGRGLALAPFVEAVRGAMADVGGRTLVVSSADLSHVGPMFGDQQSLKEGAQGADEFRSRVMNHDRAMLRLVTDLKPDDLVAAMAWQQNPTRWCSTGNIVAAIQIARPTSAKLVRYGLSVDPEGMALVSCGGVVMMSGG